MFLEVWEDHDAPGELPAAFPAGESRTMNAEDEERFMQSKQSILFSMDALEQFRQEALMSEEDELGRGSSMERSGMGCSS